MGRMIFWKLYLLQIFFKIESRMHKSEKLISAVAAPISTFNWANGTFCDPYHPFSKLRLRTVWPGQIWEIPFPLNFTYLKAILKSYIVLKLWFYSLLNFISEIDSKLILKSCLDFSTIWENHIYLKLFTHYYNDLKL